LSPEDSLKVLEELEQSPDASAELEAVANLLNFVATHGKEVFEREREATPARSSLVGGIIQRLEGFLHSRRFSYPIAAILVVFVVIGGLMVVSSLTTSEYYPLTQIERQEFESRVRGPGLQDFTMAYQAFSEARYDETIRLLERFIRAFPKSELVDYAHYSAGATYLVASERSFLFLFPSFEQDRVMRGLEHLELAIKKSSNPRTIEDSHWLRAKGYLMLGQADQAMAELQIVESMKGLKRESASRLISEIQKLQKGG
ncbi:MAG: outer membrane protein assembly factor BamD, partial [Bacteroidota bacterium]